MELDKGLCVAMMLGVVSEMSLEGKSLEWLKKTRDEQSRIVADCERSAREIREYVITEYNGRDGASALVKERKAELVEAIERQAEMVQVLVKRIDDEIGNRQYKTEKEDKSMITRRDYTGIEFPAMISDLDELRRRLEVELDTDGLINELEEVDELTKEPTREMVEWLDKHIATYKQMTSICEELRKRVNGYFGI